MPLKYLNDVVTLKFDRDKCTGCKMCLAVCPHGVFSFSGSKAILRDRDSCMECGACMLNCPAGAIQVRAGVGCAYAVLRSRLKGGEPSCGCSEEPCGASTEKPSACCSEDSSCC